MAVLTDNLIRVPQGLGGKEFIVKSGVTCYAGSMMSLESTTGHVETIVDATTDQAYVGIAQSSVVGDGSLKVVTSIDSFILPGVTVTGVSAQTDLGALVYATTDNTFSLTKATDDWVAVGRIIDWTSGTTADVAMFSLSESFAHSVAGSDIKTMGPFYVDLGALAAGNVITAHIVKQNMVFTDLYTYGVGAVAAGANADVDFNLEINTVNCTGGVLSHLLADAQAAGTKNSSTAFTGNNIAYKGDSVDIEAIENTGFTGGMCMLYVDYIPFP